MSKRTFLSSRSAVKRRQRLLKLVFARNLCVLLSNFLVFAGNFCVGAFDRVPGYLCFADPSKMSNDKAFPSWNLISDK